MGAIEACLHTRNYGCRAKRYIQGGVEMLSLENQKIKVVLALGKGADIVELVHKASDTDVMWHSFNELKNINQISTVASTGGNFLDTYAGGWQELFPTHGGNTIYHGGEIGIHGEACLYPWTCELVCDTPECVEAKLTLRTVRSPFLMEKHARLVENDATLYLTQKVTNLGSTELDFMWGHHPAFGFPFLDESVRLHLAGKPLMTLPKESVAHHCPFTKPVSGRFPAIADDNGDLIDMGRAYSPESKMYLEYGISELAEGKYELINHKKGLGVRMKWDLDVFRYLWIWGLFCGIDEYPWYGRSYVMGVEPWSSMPASYDAAKAAGTLLHLGAGKSMETAVSCELFETEQDA